MVFNAICSIIILSGMVLSLFLGIVIFAIKNNKEVNRFIGFFLIGIFMLLLRGYITHSMKFFHMPVVVMLLDSVRYLYGPIILFYIHAVIHPRRKHTIQDIAHLIPFFMYLVYVIITIIMNSGNLDNYMQNWMSSSAFQEGYILDSLMRFLFFICYCSYLVYCRNLIKTHQRTKKKLTQVEVKYLSWVRSLINYMVPTLFIWFVNGLLLLYGFKYSHVYVLMHVTISVVVILAGYSIFIRPEVLYNAKPSKNRIKYFTSPLSQDKMHMYYKKLRRLMEEEKLYLDPDFDLESLVKIMGLSRNYVSQIINEKSDKTFYEFINSYRVQEVKKHLENSSFDDLNILTIAFNSGFKSKATFYKVFKKCVGMTPLMFVKRHK